MRATADGSDQVLRLVKLAEDQLESIERTQYS
jgi:hypothetical protein